MNNFEYYDNLMDAVFVLNRDKQVIYSNETFANLVGVSVRRLSKKPYSYDVLELEDKEHFLMTEGTMDNVGEPAYHKNKIIVKDGDDGEILLFTQKVQNEGEDCFVNIIRDLRLEEILHVKYKAELNQKEDTIEELKKARAKLQEYSENLEDIVAQRTQELSNANLFLHAMLNSLDQALCVFNIEGDCLPNFTKACEWIFECQPEGKKIWDVLQTPEEKLDDAKFWVNGLFQNMIPFLDFAKLGPRNFTNKEGKYIQLDYYPMRDTQDNLISVVVVGTDKTDEQRAKQKAQKDQKYAEMIVKISNSQELFLNFMRECQLVDDELSEQIESHDDDFNLDAILASIHSIKGAAALFSIFQVESVCHRFEDRLQEYKTHHSMDEKQLNEFLHHELKAFREAVEHVKQEYKKIFGKIPDITQFSKNISLNELKDFSRKILSLKDNIPSLKEEFDNRFVKSPLLKLFAPYDEMVQQIAQKEGKILNQIQFNGHDHKVIVDHYLDLASSLVHVFRNSVGHGIETPEEREQSAKPQEGSISVELEKSELDSDTAWMSITIKDDGRGIDPQMIRKKLKEAGRPELKIDEMSDHEVIQHIFDMDISTSEGVDMLSGRGIGMGAVAMAVKKMNGEYEVESVPGEGMQLKIMVPDAKL